MSHVSAAQKISGQGEHATAEILRTGFREAKDEIYREQVNAVALECAQASSAVRRSDDQA